MLIYIVLLNVTALFSISVIQFESKVWKIPFQVKVTLFYFYIKLLIVLGVYHTALSCSAKRKTYSGRLTRVSPLTMETSRIPPVCGWSVDAKRSTLCGEHHMLYKHIKIQRRWQRQHDEICRHAACVKY